MTGIGGRTGGAVPTALQRTKLVKAGVGECVRVCVGLTVGIGVGAAVGKNRDAFEFCMKLHHASSSIFSSEVGEVVGDGVG